MFDFRKAKAFSGLHGLNVSEALKKFQANNIGPVGLTANGPLRENSDFGANPGQLRMFSYLPPHAERPTALVVMLHGCGQDAAGYDRGAGWSTLAERYGFAVLMPEQQRANNPNGCFNWFEPADTQRDRGEAASINQMVTTMVRESGIDPRRVFITGLSAGGAMTAVMLACYPDTFAAGAIIAGLPYGAATNVQEALNSMYQCRPHAAKHWGDLVRAAAPSSVRSWPRVSVWHGDADRTVIPSNAIETIKQWTDVHGLTEPSKEDSVQGYPRQVWLDGAGAELIESFAIPHMSHGTPLETGDADFQCGAAGPFLLDVGISSTFHIARFFGLTDSRARPVSAAVSGASHHAGSQHHSPVEARALHSGAPKNEPSKFGGQQFTPSRIDIGAVIAGALEKAGLKHRS